MSGARLPCPRGAIAFLLLVAACSSAGAQGAPIAARHCAPVRMDTVHGTVFGVLVPRHAGEAVPPAYGRRIIAAVAAGITDTLRVEDEFEETGMVLIAMGDTYGNETYGESTLRGAWAGLAQLSTEIAFDVDRSGLVTHARVLAPGDSAVTSIVLGAVQGAGSLAGPPPGPPRNLSLILRLSLQPDTAAIAQPLAAVAETRLRGVTRPRIHYRSLTPRFPARDERDRTGADFLFSFEVDTTGRPVPGTLITAPPADPAAAGQYGDFTTAVSLTVPAWRFDPATANGCPIRARIVMPAVFTFNWHGPDAPNVSSPRRPRR